jgi:hypothetical protein
MKKALLLTMLISFIGQAIAETELEEKVKVLNVLKKYSETVACGTSFEEQDSLESFLKDVHTIERNTENEGASIYYALWQGDKGCRGGSGTTFFYISEVSRDLSHRPFLVVSDEAFGDEFEKKVNPRFIESVKKINPDHFIVISSEFAENDANNFPSKKYQYILQRQNWVWKITSRKLLEKGVD